MNGPLTLATLLVLGVLIGVLGGLFGVGGGLFAIPLLGVAFGLNQQHAQGTALVMIVPNVIVGLWNYAKRGSMDRRIGLALAAPALPCTVLGARVATYVPSAELRLAFAIFMLAIAAVTLLRALARPGPSRPRAPWPLATLIGAFGGALSGLFSVGGAVFAVPLVAILFGTSQAVAQGFGLALVAPGTLAAIVTYGLARDVDWWWGVALALGGILAVPHGVRLAYRMPERALRFSFAALMAAGAVVLLVHLQ